MKIVFQNRQRRYSLDFEELHSDYSLISRTLGRVLLQSAPVKPCGKSILDASLIKSLFSDSAVSVVFLSNRAIARLNNDFRGINKATDVLSFPLDLERPASFPSPFMNDSLTEMDFAQPDGADSEISWLLGELFISIEKADRQADEYGHSLRRELAFLFLHGLLHLLGFDHQSKTQEKQMFAYQNEILKEVGINREGCQVKLR